MKPRKRFAKRTLPRVAATCAALFAGGLTCWIALGGLHGATGMNFAQTAQAEESSETAVAPSADRHVAETQSEATTRTMERSVFEDDPLQGLAVSLRQRSDRLASREQELAAREQLLQERERRLEALRLEIQDNMDQLAETMRRMETLAETASAQRQRQLKRWIEIYQKMEPRKVAEVVAELDQGMQLEVLSMMEVKNAAEILEFLPSELAADLSRRLAP